MGRCSPTPKVFDGEVIDTADAYLVALLRQSMSHEEAAVHFEPPTPAWAATVKVPCIDLFLHDVVEELDGRSADWADMRDDDGRVVARQPPLRRYRLSYLVTAWAPSTEIEHQLLSKVLRAIVEADTAPLPAEGFGVDADLIVVALTQSTLPAHDLWGPLKTEPRASLRLTVTAPLRPQPVTEIAPPAETLTLGVGGPDRAGVQKHTAGTPYRGGDKRWSAFRPREGG
jgi:hypothetical protein